MNVTSEVVDLPSQRARLFKPVGASGRLPTVLAWSDIFQHTGPHLRVCARLAAHGYLVATPELYGRLEPAGTVLRFEEDRQRALDDASRMELAWFDEDREALLGWLVERADVDAERLLACGWCIGGHLAFRAARHPHIKATTCFYPTGLHTDSLGAAVGTARTLADASQIRGDVLLVWGTRDPHIPKDGRQVIHGALANAGTAFQVQTFDAEHTFMRDEGPRWEPVAADEAFRAMLALFSARH